MRFSLLAPASLLALGFLAARLYTVQSPEPLRVLRGTVGIGSQGPEELYGEGWSLEVLGTGQYRIWFDEPFPAGVQNRPSVVAQSNTAVAYTVGTANDYADVSILTLSYLPTNTPLHFIAVGPK